METLPSLARCLLLFTKPTRPGKVKTRLIGALSALEAAALHQAFLEDLCARLVGGRFHLRLAWALEPGEAMPAQPLPDGMAQADGDLGTRLFQGLAAASQDFPLVAAVGSDHPELALATVEEAFDRLAAGAEVVLGPARDGGYYLIALKRQAVLPGLFAGISWSTSTVLAETRARCVQHGLRLEFLPFGDDVDVPADLERLAERLAPQRDFCPRTRALLAAWGRLEPRPQTNPGRHSKCGS